MSDLAPKKHRGPGRPKGSGDLRPKIIRQLEKSRVLDVAIEHLAKSLEGHIKEGRTREADALAVELARLGIQVSPKTTEIDSGTQIRLVINGIEQPRAIDCTPSPSELDAAPSPKALLPHEQESLERRARCYPQPYPRPAPAVAPATPPEEDPPVRGPVFVVPRGPDAPLPEWRTPLYED